MAEHILKGWDVLLDLHEGVLIVGGRHHPESSGVTMRVEMSALQLGMALRLEVIRNKRKARWFKTVSLRLRHRVRWKG